MAHWSLALPERHAEPVRLPAPALVQVLELVQQLGAAWVLAMLHGQSWHQLLPGLQAR